MRMSTTSHQVTGGRLKQGGELVHGAQTEYQSGSDARAHRRRRDRADAHDLRPSRPRRARARCARRGARTAVTAAAVPQTRSAGGTSPSAALRNDLRDGPDQDRAAERGERGSPASAASECSARFAKPRPGSRMMRSRANAGRSRDVARAPPARAATSPADVRRTRPARTCRASARGCASGSTARAAPRDDLGQRRVVGRAR